MTDRDRIQTVLRVRRVQELQAVGEMARARAEAAAAQARLEEHRGRYDGGRDIDLRSDLVPARLRDRDVRVLHAKAIQRGREAVKAALAAAEERQLEAQVRSQAVKALERLDERLAETEAEERRRAEILELDERGAVRAGAASSEWTS